MELKLKRFYDKKDFSGSASKFMTKHKIFLIRVRGYIYVRGSIGEFRKSSGKFREVLGSPKTQKFRRASRRFLESSSSRSRGARALLLTALKEMNNMTWTTCYVVYIYIYIYMYIYMYTFKICFWSKYILIRMFWYLL